MINKNEILNILLNKDRVEDNFSLATVESISPLKILIDGDMEVLPYEPLKLRSSMDLQLEDRVLIYILNNRVIILGALGEGYLAMNNLTTDSRISILETKNEELEQEVQEIRQELETLKGGVK